jgi:hypothetical protein
LDTGSGEAVERAIVPTVLHKIVSVWAKNRHRFHKNAHNSRTAE